MIQSDRLVPLTLLVLCQVGAMALWFSASAVVPALRLEFGLGDARASLFTSAVQFGFVVGTVISALLALADRIDPRRFFLCSCLVAAGANGLILFLGPEGQSAILMRFITGICMAGIYPVGMKMASTWARGDMGLVVGLLVGALTLGSASPHLFAAFGGLDWRLTLGLASISAGICGFLILGVRLGPNMTKAPPFRPTLALEAWRNRPLRYANLGYFGHMWELYAMWAWIGIFLQASFTAADMENAAFWAAAGTFAVIGIGALGCVGGGLFADRLGRTTLTILAMAVSGSCAVLVGFLFAGAPFLLVLLCLVWGIAVVADSAQFSASVAELSEPGLVGTMLTVQTSVGFLLTMVTIHLLPIWVDAVGWTYAFAGLAIGPALGCLAMWRLRAMPEAAKLAGGNR